MIFRRRREPTGPASSGPVASEVVSAVTASSATIPPERWGKATKANTGAESGWQGEAWERLEDVGELSFALLWKTALLSRFRLVASDLDPETGKPTGSTDNALARDIVRRIAGGTTGQSQLLGRLAPLLMIPGEGFLAIIYPDTGEEWHILSREEVKSRGDKVELMLSDGRLYEMDDEHDTLSRIWRPDPRRSWLAWSPTKAALPILREIVRMSQNIEGAGKSRQAGNGVLLLPAEISMPPAAPPVAAPNPDAPSLPPPPVPVAQFASPGEIRAAIQEAMSTGIADPSSAAALVPIILQGKGEHLDKIRHLKFDSEVSEKAQAAREAAVRRLAMTLDMPPEVLLGLADLNHWSLYGVEEEAVRWHASPEMELICDSLTRELLLPMLGDQAAGVVVWYDTSDVDAEPDQVEKVAKAYADGVVNSEEYLRQLGLGDEAGYDLTTREGWEAWAIDQVRKDPALLQSLAPIIPALPELPTPAPAVAPEPAELEAPARPRTPDRELAASGAVVRLCVNEALRLAGKRRRTRGDHARLRTVQARDTHLPQNLGPVPAGDVDRLISGWDEVVDDDTLASAGLSREALHRVVTATARDALTLGRLPRVDA